MAVSTREWRYLTLKQVAERLQVGLRTIERRVAEGSLPAVRIGRSVRVDERELDEWVHQLPDDVHVVRTRHRPGGPVVSESSYRVPPS